MILKRKEIAVIVLTVKIRSKKDKIDQTRALLKSFVAPSQAEKGCVQYELFEGAKDSQIFYFFEKWESQAAFELHSQQPFLKKFRELYGELLEQPNELLPLRVVG